MKINPVVEVRAQDVMPSMTIRVKVNRVFRVRMWLGLKMLALAGLMLGVGHIEIDS